MEKAHQRNLDVGEVYSVSRFTPGPYSLANKFSENLFSEAVSIDILGADGYPVAELRMTAILPDYYTRLGIEHWADAPGRAYIERDPEEVLATAHLLAAAPELYEALKVALEDLEDWVDASHQYQDNSGNWVSREYCECHTCNVTLPLIRRVLAKAEGRSE